MKFTMSLLALLTLSSLLVNTSRAQTPSTSFVTKLGVDIDVRSGSRILEDDLATNSVILPDLAGPVAESPAVPQIQLRGGNLQTNDPNNVFIQQFTSFRPFVRATQSEVSTAAFGRNIVVTYNDSAGIHVSLNPAGPGLIVDHVQLSGFATSNDGGQTWKSGFVPAAAGATETFGDPSVGVDRHGVFYFANLGADAALHSTVQVNKSTDGGNTWSPGVIVQVDNGRDKEWLAVGPDPVVKSRDNVYVTWTSFQRLACELRFGVSTDGGATFAARTIFVPASNPDFTKPQNCLQASNPVVDSITGTLYVPFLRFSNADGDFIQMLVSDDAGASFHFANFNIPGAPDPTLLPLVQPGDFTSCGFNNFRLTIHDSAFGGFGQFGIPRYIDASRLFLQPAFAARDGVLYMAWDNSTSPFLSDHSAKSNILFIRSDDGGATWTAPIVVNPTDNTDTHHVHPSLAIDEDPTGVHISYYTQHSNGTIDLDMANSHDRGNSFPADRTVRVTSTSMNLPPTNIPLTGAPFFTATNYDRQIAVCYALGEYHSITTANGSVYVGWGDTRNTITEPVDPLDPISGQTHPQEDVFFQKLKAQ